MKSLNISWHRYDSDVKGYSYYIPKNQFEPYTHNPLLDSFVIQEYSISDRGTPTRYVDFDSNKDSIIWISTNDYRYFESLLTCQQYLENLITKYVNELINESDKKITKWSVRKDTPMLE